MTTTAITPPPAQEQQQQHPEPQEQLPPSIFTCFPSLPKELRLLVWEQHFQAERIHVIHPAPESHGRRPPREVLLFNCTVLDAATNIAVPAQLLAWPANKESLVVSRSMRKAKDRGELVPLAWELVKPYVERRALGDGETLSEGQIEAGSDVPHFANWRAALCDVRIDWAADLVYLSVAHAEQSFWALRYAECRTKVRRLAVLIPQSFLEDGSQRPIPFGPAQFLREVLESLENLEDLYVAFQPLPGTIPRNNAASALRRDRYGFVSYVEYLKKVGVSGNHMSFSRAALSFQQANAMHSSALHKVVDIDYIPSDYGRYQRRFK
ncbi:hypothetical protein GGR56DRAFT_633285 [Xylariaceae sp. FL0804]|nr:hypothetical protein GGR56DRAFT_633285 [Xylariaceae sp. FL0804]